MVAGAALVEAVGVRRPMIRRDLILALAVGGAVGGVYTIFSALQWRSYAVMSWDLGIFTQLASDYAHLRPPIVPIKGPGYNLLGDHFHPILVLLGPVYAVFPHAFALVVLQNILFGIAAAVIAWTGSTVLKSKVLGVVVGIAFGLSWGLQSAVEVQFHEVAFAVPLVALSLCMYLRGRWVASALWAAPLVFVKEDLGLTVIAVGLLILAKTRTPLGLWLVVWGLGWFALAIFVVLPMFNPSGHWTYGGSIDLDALINRPAVLLDPQKAYTVWLLALATGFAALRSPVALVLVPTLAWRFLSTNHGYAGPGWHYSAVLMPVAFCAAIDGIRRFRESPRVWARRTGLATFTVMASVAVALIPQFPLGKLASPSQSLSTWRSASAEKALAAVPDGAAVETDIGLMSYLVDRTNVYWLGNKNPTPDYVVVDHISGGTPGEWKTVLDVTRALHPRWVYRTVFSADGYEVAERITGAAGTDR